MKSKQSYSLGPKLPVWLSTLIIWGSFKKGWGVWQWYFLAAENLEGKKWLNPHKHGDPSGFWNLSQLVALFTQQFVWVVFCLWMKVEWVVLLILTWGSIFPYLLSALQSPSPGSSGISPESIRTLREWCKDSNFLLSISFQKLGKVISLKVPRARWWAQKGSLGWTVWRWAHSACSSLLRASSIHPEEW